MIPELTSTQFDQSVPSKAPSYKEDAVTGFAIVKKRPATQKFEKDLKTQVNRAVQENNKSAIFPTQKEVLLLMELGLSAKTDYNETDLDNRAKTICDALKGVIYQDDNQISVLICRKHIVKNKYFKITIKIIDEKSHQPINDILDIFEDN